VVVVVVMVVMVVVVVVAVVVVVVVVVTVVVAMLVVVSMYEHPPLATLCQTPAQVMVTLWTRRHRWAPSVCSTRRGM
jgi:hypothetical protein